MFVDHVQNKDVQCTQYSLWELKLSAVYRVHDYTYECMSLSVNTIYTVHAVHALSKLHWAMDINIQCTCNCLQNTIQTDH